MKTLEWKWLTANVLAAASALACAPALKTPAEIVDFARAPGVGDVERLFDALRSPVAPIRANGAWALGSKALDDGAKPNHAMIAKHLVRAFNAEWKRSGGPDAAALGAMIRAIGNTGETADGGRVASYLRVLSPSLQGGLTQMALGFAARKVDWAKQLDDAIAKIAASEENPIRKLALIAAARANKPLPAATLEKALASRDAEIRAAAVKVARGSNDVPTERLDRLLQNDADWRVQVEAARTLVHRKESARIADFAVRLWRQIRDNAKELESVKGVVVLAALESLFVAKSLPPAVRVAIEEVYATAKDIGLTTPWVTCRAAMILDAIDKTSVRTRDCGGTRMPTWRRAGLVAELAAKLPRKSEAVTELITSILKTADTRVRAAILPAVVYLEPEVARPVFVEALAGPDPVLAAVAADTIAQQSRIYFKRSNLGMAMMAAARRHARGENVEAIITLATVLGQYPPGEVDAVFHELSAHPEPSVASIGARLDRFHAHLNPKFKRPTKWRGLDAAAAKPAALPRTAKIVTSKGSIEIRFHADVAPRTVANFAELARKGFYNGLDFHRVVPNFVVQGGDPRVDGWGGPGYTIPCEPHFAERPYVRGSVGMALAGRHTGGSQFFITHSAQPHLDGRYTNFATVIAGLDVVDRIIVGDKIVRVTVD